MGSVLLGFTQKRRKTDNEGGGGWSFARFSHGWKQFHRIEECDVMLLQSPPPPPPPFLMQTVKERTRGRG